jgi:integrase
MEKLNKDFSKVNAEFSPTPELMLLIESESKHKFLLIENEKLDEYKNLLPKDKETFLKLSLLDQKKQNKKLEQENNKQQPCAPLDWDVFKDFLSRLALDIIRTKGEKKKTLAKYHAVCALGGFTGMRGSDLLEVTWSMALDKEKYKVVEGKTEKKRVITVNEKCKALVEHDHIIVNPYSDNIPILHNIEYNPIGINGFNRYFARLLDKYGVVTENPSSHTLRKTFGKRFWETNGSTEKALVTLSQIFNHRNIEETRKYIGITEQVISDGYKNLE